MSLFKPPLSRGPIVVQDAVVPNQSDTVDLTNGPCAGFMVGVTGDVKIITLGGNAIVLPACQAGLVYSIGARRIFTAGAGKTTATGIVVLY